MLVLLPVHWEMITKRKLKQWWSTIPPIPTKQTITPHLKSFNIKKMMTYMMFWKSKSLLGTGTKCGRLNQSMGSWCLKLLCSIFVFTIQKGSDYNYWYLLLTTLLDLLQRDSWWLVWFYGVFNATFNNIQLYCGGQFYWLRKPEDPEKTVDLRQVTDKLDHIMLYSSPWAGFKITTSLV